MASVLGSDTDLRDISTLRPHSTSFVFCGKGKKRKDKSLMSFLTTVYMQIFILGL